MKIITLLHVVNWVNYAKVIGIIAVVLGHLESPYGSFIFTWHMPLFFFLSGFFLKTDQLPKQFIISNIKRLMIPYFIFAIVGLLAEIIKRTLLDRPSLNLIHEVLGIFVKMDMEGLKNQYGFVLWFLPALLTARISLYFILKMNKFSYAGLFVFSCLCMLAGINLELPFGIDQGLTAVPWLTGGYIYFSKFSDRKQNDILIPLSCLAILLLIPRPALDMASKSYENVFLNIIWACIFIVMLIDLIKRIPPHKIIQLVGAETLIVFLLHPYTNNAAVLICQRFGLNYWTLELILSLMALSVIVGLKTKYKKLKVLKYV